MDLIINARTDIGVRFLLALLVPAAAARGGALMVMLSTTVIVCVYSGLELVGDTPVVVYRISSCLGQPTVASTSHHEDRVTMVDPL